ncbi:MAG: hypothetical protein JJT89_13445 [Nitriliruptoraceae bacterium]|nr:hypothetical protein [Nitriliruptoraceae bacterium]
MSSPRNRPQRRTTVRRPATTRGHLRAEDGAITGASLLQTLAILAVFGLLVFEVVSVVVSTATLDEAGRELARAAGEEYRVSRSIDATTAALEPLLEEHDARIRSIEILDDELVLELERDAPTVIAHRLPPLAGLATPTASARTTWMS